jgi:valyl-tRNA synthetase
LNHDFPNNGSVKVGPLAKAAGDAVRDGRVKIEPAELEPRYFDWVDNMHDRCISRQLWWGHRIPVFYGPNDEIVVCGPDEEPPAEYTQDPDVLDTWFSPHFGHSRHSAGQLRPMI